MTPSLRVSHPRLHPPLHRHPRVFSLLLMLIAVAALLTAGGCASVVGGTGSDPRAAAIRKLEITSIESPAFQGRAFGQVGTYEKIRGKAHAELDPADPRNATITDLALAPRNARGKVEYSYDFVLLRPVDAARGNRKLFYEVTNRGRMLVGPLIGAALTNDPTTAAHAGNGFLLEQGYTIAWSGWDFTAPATDNLLTATLPVARNADGTPITGPVYESFTFDNATTIAAGLIHPTARRDITSARLTVKDRLTDRETVIPASGWTFADDRSIRLLPAGTPFKQGAIYELSYTARDPVVAGIGFALVRDFVSFLRHGKADAAGQPNPVAGRIDRALAYTVSQPARFMNDFVWLGFNEDARGGKVFEGVQNWIGAGTGVAANVRFALPLKTERNRQQKLHPEATFPFSYSRTTDPLTGRTDGRNARCERTGTCPLILNVNSSNEYWVKAGSLLHTDARGNDLPDPPNVRNYLLSSLEHTIAGSPATPGVCALPRNPIDPSPVLRALFVALDRWVDGVEPPASRVPRRADGTAVMIRDDAKLTPFGLGEVPQAELGWPSIPGVLYTGMATTRTLLDFGPQADRGILAQYPPRATDRTYPAFVSKVDADGHEVAGIRLPPVAAPIATYTGWGLRSAAHGGPDGCEHFGQSIPFAAARAEREAKGDPRLSLEERYRSHEAYVEAVARAARALEAERLLLPEDVQRYVAAARSSAVRK